MTSKKKSYKSLIIFNAVFITIHLVICVVISLGKPNDLSLIPLVIGDLIFSMIYMILHGFITYYTYRKVLCPNLITSAFVIVSTLITLLCPSNNHNSLIGMNVYLCAFLLCSFIVSFVTMIAFKLFGFAKKNK